MKKKTTKKATPAPPAIVSKAKSGARKERQAINVQVDMASYQRARTRMIKQGHTVRQLLDFFFKEYSRGKLAVA